MAKNNIIKEYFGVIEQSVLGKQEIVVKIYSTTDGYIMENGIGGYTTITSEQFDKYTNKEINS